jgi:hypothetical protein
MQEDAALAYDATARQYDLVDGDGLTSARLCNFDPPPPPSPPGYHNGYSDDGCGGGAADSGVCYEPLEPRMKKPRHHRLRRIVYKKGTASCDIGPATHATATQGLSSSASPSSLSTHPTAATAGGTAPSTPRAACGARVGTGRPTLGLGIGKEAERSSSSRRRKRRVESTEELEEIALVSVTQTLRHT